MTRLKRHVFARLHHGENTWNLEVRFEVVNDEN